MSGLFSGGLGKLASPLPKSIDPVGNKTSDVLFGSDRNKKTSDEPQTPTNTTSSAGRALGLGDTENDRQRRQLLGY